jgi:glycosyltransferase involved in cell wall biosynthesis
MKVLTFSTLYPNAARPAHGVFVETRLRQLVASGQAEARVLAPVPWFPFRQQLYGDYARHARAPRVERRQGIVVMHPRYPVLPKVGMSVAPLLLSRAVAPTLERIHRHFPFDLIDAHYFYPDGVAAVMLGKRARKPVVVTARGSDINLIAKHRLPRAMIRWAARNAAAVVTVSRALKDALVELGVPPEHVRVLRNGVDTDLFKPVEREAVRQRLGMTRKTILSVGNLLDFKGHGIVISALSLLPECELVVIGEGPDRRRFHMLARDSGVAERVRFLGSIPQAELRQYYGAADALVLGSSREGWPNVLLEAMACGTPVIASDVGGVSEIVTAAEAGIVLEERSAAAVARAVGALLANPPDRSATRRYAEQFGWDATTRGQLQLFRQILAAGAEGASRDVRSLRRPAF